MHAQGQTSFCARLGVKKASLSRNLPVALRGHAGGAIVALNCSMWKFPREKSLGQRCFGGVDYEGSLADVCTRRPTTFYGGVLS